MTRKKRDEELGEILGRLDDNELFGLKFGMLPAGKIKPGDLSSQDVARLMELNPKGCL